MAGAELGNSVQEVESLLKRHENLEKLILTQEEKIEALKELSDNLENHEHFASEILKERVSSLCQRHERLQNLINQRREQLEDSNKLTKFYQDIVEVCDMFEFSPLFQSYYELNSSLSLCSGSEWRSSSTVLTFMLNWSEQIIPNYTDLLPNTRPTHIANI